MRTIKEEALEKKWDFIYHSNMIEQISIPRQRYLASEESFKYPEIKGHSDAYNFMVLSAGISALELGDSLTELLITTGHGMLTEGLVSPKYRGAYRDCRVWIGGHEAIPSVAIKPAMERLIALGNQVKTEKHTWIIHDLFEQIHPFIDGNGRTGRLLLNFLRVKIGLGIEVIKFEDRFKYYEKIAREGTPYRVENLLRGELTEFPKED